MKYSKIYFFSLLICISFYVFPQDAPKLSIALYLESNEFYKEQDIASIVFFKNEDKDNYEYRLPIQPQLIYALYDEHGVQLPFPEDNGDWPLRNPNYILKPDVEIKDFQYISSLSGNSKFEKGIYERPYLLPGRYKLKVLYNSDVIMGSERQKISYVYQSNEVEFMIKEITDSTDEKVYNLLKNAPSINEMGSGERFISTYEGIIAEYPENKYTKLAYERLLAFYSVRPNRVAKLYDELKYNYLLKYCDSFCSLPWLPILTKVNSPYYQEFAAKREAIISKLKQSALLPFLKRSGFWKKLGVE